MTELQQIVKDAAGLLTLDGRPISFEKIWVGTWFRAHGPRMDNLLSQAQTHAPEEANAVYVPEVTRDGFDGIAFYRCDPIYFKLPENKE